MKKTYWINFLHFYLPPTSESEIIHEAAKKSYQWLILMAKKNKNFKFTFNISGCLTEMLKNNDYKKLLDDIKNLLSTKQLELADTLAYHPIAPLIPEKEILEQIKINRQINKENFNIMPKGFFLPEMAYSPKVGQLIASLGYKWLILDEISHNGERGKIDWNKKYILKNSKLKIIYRSAYWSTDYPPRKIMHHLRENTLPKHIISATDAELYGHRFIDNSNWLQQTLAKKEISCLTISDYLKSLKNYETTNPVSSNWESLENELVNNKPFPLWANEKNNIHLKLWELANLAIKEIKNHPQDENIYWAIKHLRNGLASCTFWWASGRDFKLFGAPAWKPDEVERGANELIKVIRTIKLSTAKKIAAEKLYFNIKKNLWTKHWKKYDKK